MEPLTQDSTTFGLLRHGQTIWNKERRIQGSGNSVLTPEGIIASRQWAHYLLKSKTRWDRIIASPLQRTQDTANIINEVLKLPIHINYDIREQDWGKWEGQTLDQIKKDHPGEIEKQILRGWEFRPPEGESRKEVLARAIDALKQDSAKWHGENLLIISHLGIIKTVLYSIENRNFMPEEPKVAHKNHFHTIRFKDNVFSITNRSIELPKAP